MHRTDGPIQKGKHGQESGGIGESLREVGRQVQATAHEHVHGLRQAAAEYYETGREKAAAMEHRFEDYVRERPMKSLLIAAGIGLCLGFLWRRR